MTPQNLVVIVVSRRLSPAPKRHCLHRSTETRRSRQLFPVTPCTYYGRVHERRAEARAGAEAGAAACQAGRVGARCKVETAFLSDLEVAAVDRAVSCLGSPGPLSLLPCPVPPRKKPRSSNTPRKDMARSWLLISISVTDLPVTIVRQPWHQPPQLDHQPFLSPAYPCPDLVVIPCPVQKALQNPGSCLRPSKTLTNPPGLWSQSLHKAQRKNSLRTAKASHMTEPM